MYGASLVPPWTRTSTDRCFSCCWATRFARGMFISSKRRLVRCAASSLPSPRPTALLLSSASSIVTCFLVVFLVPWVFCVLFCFFVLFVSFVFFCSFSLLFFLS